MGSSEVGKSFYYPEYRGEPTRRMCASGQRRAASEGWNLLAEGGEIGKDQTLTRAARTEKMLECQADVNKHSLISYVVLFKYANGTLGDFVNIDGDFVLETFSGKSISVNIFEEIEAGKDIF